MHIAKVPLRRNASKKTVGLHRRLRVGAGGRTAGGTPRAPAGLVRSYLSQGSHSTNKYC
jgi:hypothetical protein